MSWHFHFNLTFQYPALNVPMIHATYVYSACLSGLKTSYLSSWHKLLDSSSGLSTWPCFNAFCLQWKLLFFPPVMVCYWPSSVYWSLIIKEFKCYTEYQHRTIVLVERFCLFILTLLTILVYSLVIKEPIAGPVCWQLAQQLSISNLSINSNHP